MQKRLGSFNPAGAVELWLEHDLFDQLLLSRHLDWFSHREMGDTRLTLICIDHFPGIHRFFGLGDLDAEQIATLFGTQESVTAEQLRLGRSAWAAFRSPDPHEIEAVLSGDTKSLPLLAKASRRHFAGFPSTRNGPSRTQSFTLAKLGQGSASPSDLFRDALDHADDPLTSDATFFALLRTLAEGSNPLIEPIAAIDSVGAHAFFGPDYRLTNLGRRVVAGDADRVAECGIDRHLGGVYLRGHHVAWRWDEAAGWLVAVQGA